MCLDARVAVFQNFMKIKPKKAINLTIFNWIFLQDEEGFLTFI